MRHLIVTLGIFFGMLLTVSAVAAQVNYVSVMVRGTGEDMRAAIYDGLQSAIEQVNGAKISSQTMLSISETSVSQSDGSSQYLSSQDFAQDLISQTDGIVKEYSILNSGLDASLGGLNFVELKVVVAKFKRSNQLSRKRIAVMPFRMDESISPGNAVILVEAFSQALVSYLTQTRRFALLEREYLAEQQAELGILASGQTPPEELARLGQMAGADLILVGEVTKARTHENTVVSEALDISRTTYVGNVDVSYRVLDVATGQVKWADQSSGNAEAEMAGGLLTKIVQRVANDIGKNIVDAIYPLTVAAVSGDELVLGQGGKTVKVGQRLKLVMLGQAIQDKYTGESLGAEEIVIGEIEIVSVTPKQSRAIIITSNQDLFSIFGSVDFLARPLNTANNPTSIKKQNAEDLKQDFESSFDEFEEENAEQW